jgi:hypothetical protein
MRRLFLRVLSECPVITRDESSGKWLVRWGDQVVAESSAENKLLPLFQLVQAAGVPSEKANFVV